MYSRKAFTLTEILIAVVLMGLVILAVASVDITSRRFFDTSSKESWIQDEAKIAMEHIIKNTQLGVGDMSNPETADGTNPPTANNSRGFYILDDEGDLAQSGSRIQVKQDTDDDGTYDRIIDYEYQGAPDYKLVYDPDVGTAGDEETLAEGIVESVIFSFDSDTPNQVKVTITVLSDPSKSKSLENPGTTLTSSIVLRAMSCK